MIDANLIIDQIADKLAVPAEKLMSAVPYFVIHNVMGMIFDIIILVSLVFGMKFFGRKYTEAEENHDDCFGWVMAIFVCIVVIFIMSIALYLDISSVFLWIANKDAWSVKYILDLFKNNQR